MAVIKFDDYVIERSNYEFNGSFEGPDENDGLIIENDFNVNIGIKGDKGFVRINVKLGDRDDSRVKHIPFFADLIIRGIFSFTEESESEDKDSLEKFISINAVAILYPYLRAHVSSLTLSSNQFPSYVLPVMNFAKMMEEEGKVQIDSDL